MKKPDIDHDVELLFKYWNGQLSEPEKKELEAWVKDSESRKRMLEILKDENLLSHELNEYEGSEEKFLRNRIAELEPELKQDNNGKIIYWPRFMAAAAIIIVVGLSSTFYFLRKNGKPTNIVAQTSKTDIEPGTYKATLKLADGRSIVLDSSTGQSLHQGATEILNKNGKLVYTKPVDGIKGEVLWNTLSTAKGQTYPLLLSDGTLVTLNSESSIRFPVAFTIGRREVLITGEAFFQVAHDASKPFKVTAKDMELQVLGTTFNVNAYEDEDAIKTTLVEGKVKLRSTTNNVQAILAPGEQAKFIKQSQALIKTKDVDVDAEVAWRFGYFNFSDADVKSVMRQLERWYNVEVVYEGTTGTNLGLFGQIPRSMPLSQVLNLLEGHQLHFKMEGKKIIVTP
jgi:hypothetical protein